MRVGNKLGYIKHGGEIVIEPQFDSAMSFSEGLAGVKIGNKWGYINTEGEVVIKPQFDDARSFSKGVLGRPGVEGLAPVLIRGEGWVYTNRAGKFFNQVRSFSEGLAAVQVGNKWGYVNPIGEIVIEPQFDDAKNFSEGLGRVQIGDKWGYINTEGEVVIKPQFDDAGGFTTVK